MFGDSVTYYVRSHLSGRNLLLTLYGHRAAFGQGGTSAPFELRIAHLPRPPIWLSVTVDESPSDTGRILPDHWLGLELVLDTLIGDKAALVPVPTITATAREAMGSVADTAGVNQWGQTVARPSGYYGDTLIVSKHVFRWPSAAYSVQAERIADHLRITYQLDSLIGRQGAVGPTPVEFAIFPIPSGVSRISILHSGLDAKGRCCGTGWSRYPGMNPRYLLLLHADTVVTVPAS